MCFRENIWDLWAPRYDRLWAQRYSLGPTRAAILRTLSPPGGRIRMLDVGCGTGQLFGEVSVSFPGAEIAYTGIDRSAAMIEHARAKYPAGRFLACDVGDLNTADEPAFDRIVCAHAFPYFQDKPGAMRFFCDSLAPGGVLLLAQACADNAYDHLALALVRLTTSPARYLGRAALRALAAPLFGMPFLEERIGRQVWLPSIYLLAWRRPRQTDGAAARSGDGAPVSGGAA